MQSVKWTLQYLKCTLVIGFTIRNTITLAVEKTSIFFPIHRCLPLIYHLKHRFLVFKFDINYILLENVLIHISCIDNTVKFLFY